jgi:hypothetical protein
VMATDLFAPLQASSPVGWPTRSDDHEAPPNSTLQRSWRRCIAASGSAVDVLLHAARACDSQIVRVPCLFLSVMQHRSDKHERILTMAQPQ